MPAVETTALSKTYQGKVEALKELSIKVEEKSIFGLLGPNGAGKTTLIKLLLGITFPTSGTAKILNEPIENYQVKYRIGYLPENHRYPSYLKGGEVLRFYGKLSGMEGEELERKIDDLLALMQLSKWKNSKVKTYSKGMMQRLGLAQALLIDPELIFLDEPTDGVDPIGRKEIRDILVELKGRGKTIFLNSHLLSEVELVTDRVAILNKGVLLKEGSVSELTEKKEEYKIIFDNLDSLPKDIEDKYNIARSGKNIFTVKVKETAKLHQLLDELRSRNILFKEVSQQKGSLEDMFISLIKEAENSK